jgi:hypothetical protein
MKAESTAIIDEAPEGGFWAICPEIPGANGQGETKEEAKENLREAIAHISRIDWRTGFAVWRLELYGRRFWSDETF